MEDTITSYIGRLEKAFDQVIKRIEIQQQLFQQRIEETEYQLAEERQRNEDLINENLHTLKLVKKTTADEFNEQIQEYSKREQILLQEIKNYKKQLSVLTKQRNKDVDDLRMIISELEEILAKT
ncbi:MAG: hypothetical protein OXC02_03335 [Rhodobacteraceae bacterium]|nr:hypothetical protein [Paracoccaceae bacterium]